ncbi:MAG: carboxypeptidase regulatory-like domain-containing protein, partial [Gemmatimonadaceae bacterium]
HVLSAQAVPPAAPAAFSGLKGIVIDSIHNVPLSQTNVLIEGTDRSALTDKTGEYHIDSIPPGDHRVVVLDALLDTMGLQMRTREFPFRAGVTHSLDLAVPAGEGLVRMLCPPARIALGPAVMLGFVRDPDTNLPAPNAKVELVYQVSDPIGRKTNTVRSAMTDSAGVYRICGIPADMSGKVQVFRNGVSSGEVPADVNNLVSLRAFGIVSKHQTVVEVKGDSGKVKRMVKGNARVTGKIVDKTGKPLSGARVVLQGGGTVAISKANGDFTLDSLPAGTQALEVRKLGYASADEPVELSSITPAHTTITLGDFIPTLAVMRTEAAQDKALSDIGYLQRKKSSATGYFMDGTTINHDALSFSDVMRVAPGLRISPNGDGRTYSITDSRSGGGCVNYFVDGFQWTSLVPGDIDDYVKPNELVAIEVYHGSGAPPQYTVAGQSSCATIVAWTVAKVRPVKGKSP